MNFGKNQFRQDRRKFIKTASGSLVLLNTLNFPVSRNVNFKKNNSNDFWEKVRHEFPLSKDRVYLNNGTFGPSPKVVLDRLTEEYREINISANYGSTKSTFEAVANYFDVSPDEISLTHNTTEGINIISSGLELKQGDEVILTDQEHVGNALPWLNRVKTSGIVLKVFSPGISSDENISKIKNLITERTKVIAVPHICCTTGLVLPIKEIGEIAEQKGIFTAIDGAHGMGSLDLNLSELQIDSYATCGHKWLLGPGGTGALYIRKSSLPKVLPVHVGAYSDTSWTLDTDKQEMGPYSPKAHRFFYGTQGKAIFSGLDAAISFQESIGLGKIENRIRTLNNLLFDGLQEFTDKIKILTPEENESRFCMVTFRPLKEDYKEVARKITQKGFRIRQVPESKTNGIRVSTHIYNSEKEVFQFLQALEEIL